jgi:hypothetical protein
LLLGCEPSRGVISRAGERTIEWHWPVKGAMEAEAVRDGDTGMTEEELYLFDLRGYLVIKGALSPEEVAQLNDLIDARPPWAEASGSLYIHTGFDQETMDDGNKDPEQGPVDFYSGLLLDWGDPIRRLVGHPAVISYLKELVGADFRLDHGYAIFQKKGHGASGHELHGGGSPYDPMQFYLHRDGRPVNGLTVFSFALTDALPGAGGFCCIPGSHKSNMPFPERYKDLGNPVEAVVQIPVAAGDVIVFTEALSHGALRWTAGHERRALLFKYCPGCMQWERNSPFVDVDRYQWTDTQRAILRPPYFGGRTGVDGEPPGK